MGVDVEEKTLITKEFMEKVLKRKIVSLKSTGGSNPGDNFTSILISLEVHLVDTKEPLYLLFKTFPNHRTRQKFLEESNIFLKEFLVYDVWMKELVQFQTEFAEIENILKPAVPQLVAGAAIDYENDEMKLETNPLLQNYLLMVDVRKTWGFKMANKLTGLGYHHVKVVLEELAKLHALTYAYKKHKGIPTIRSVYPFVLDPFFANPLEPTVPAMINVNQKVVSDVLDDFFKERPEIAEAFKRLAEPGKASKYFEMFLNPDGTNEEAMEKLMSRKPNEYLCPPLQEQWIVGGHGDCWTNNMLFKSDDTGKVTDVILVDLQLARESCIMADIVYFIYTSTDSSFRKKYLDEMLTLYCDKFVEFCKILKVDPFKGFTFDNFKRKFHRSKICGFYFALLVIPIILQKPEAAMDMDMVDVRDADEDAGLAGMFEKMSARDEDDKKRLRDRFQGLLTELYDEGVL